MKVSDIKQQKRNTDRFSVFVDGKYRFSLTANDLLAEEIKIGTPLSEADITRLKQKSTDSLLVMRTIEKCLRRPHSEREIRDYLWRKRTAPEQIDSVIERCYELRLLDDNHFAERWIEHRTKQNKSTRFIKNELRQKGVDQSIVDELMGDADVAALKALIAKKRSRYKTDEKLITYLQRQGFRYSDIKSVLTNEED